MDRVPLGCDVAPRKGGDLFDGKKFVQLTPQELVNHFSALRSRPEFVVAWDAPLTGPPDPAGRLTSAQDLTMRPIEGFFRSADWDFRPPKGISVLPYSGCPHWTITQRVIGLPRVGPHAHDLADLPFRLLCSQDDLGMPSSTRPAVVEVHPAVAIWLWCRDADVRPEVWAYKRNPARVRKLWKLLCERIEEANRLPVPENDDQLDAEVAWLLADRWVRGMGVVLLGTEQTGSFLVPKIETLLTSFDRFLRAR